MKKLSKDDIFKADDLPTKDIDIPKWGGTLTIRTLTGAERDQFESAFVNQDQIDIRGLKARLIQLTVQNGDGQPMFTKADLQKINSKSASVIDRIFQVSQSLSGLTKEDAEEMVKNSGTAPTTASGSC